ncbi:MAG: tryptophan--tRNA ligase [Planctomycetota bacterium]|nr:MAG: tryptophan--tRNA ligase [Planctomycetota bacterium]
MTATKPTIFSGIQPTGELHLGNYIGAIRQWVDTQDEYFNILCAVDLHAITVYQDPAELRQACRQTVGILLASGLDPEKCLIYIQSHVHAHAELAWILNCMTPVGWLLRMTQYKDKSQTQESVSTGLLDYPVLQAADILLFDADLVPTGEDQRAHIELTRDIAGRFNSLLGETFKLPKPMIPKVGAKIRGLDDPSVKMSKSVLKNHPHHGISLLDDPKKILKTFKRAVTDSGSSIEFSEEPEKAGVDNLLTIYQALSGKTQDEVIKDFASARGYGDLKLAVGEAVVEALRPLQTRYAEIMADPSYVDNVLHTSAQKARELCATRMEKVKEAVGFVTEHK